MATSLHAAEAATSPVPTSTEEISPATRRQLDIAAKLTALTGGRLEVSFDDGRFHAGEWGHRFWGTLSTEADDIELDDREPAPLQEQLTSELRRISRLYAELADQVEGGAA